MEMQGKAKQIFHPLEAEREFGRGATAPQNLEIFFEVSTECVPLQNAACANFAKEKSESPLCGAVEQTEWIMAL